MNFHGGRDHFTPVDKAQEKNIKAVKVVLHYGYLTRFSLKPTQVSFRVIGPFATWDAIGRISPAIPSLEAVRRHMEKQVRTVYRGSSHTNPSHEKDVRTLEDAYMASHVHEYIPSRRIERKNDIALDFVQKGTQNLRKTIEQWWEQRTFARATEQCYDTMGVD